MKVIRQFTLAAAAMLVLAAPVLAAGTMADEVRAINNSWAHIAYELRGSRGQGPALAQLEAQSEALVLRYPGQADPLVWQGVVVAEQANTASFLRKLGFASRARDLFTKAYDINPRAANGGAALGLGVLYYKVPGSPLGFGDKVKARRLIREALAIAPDSLDANFFYGDFLYGQGDKAGAKVVLQKALRAPRDSSRPVADAGRRADVNAVLRKIG
ncbi:MAG: tetratricopeptide repeat protein [Croceibacterium sp.]